MFLFKFLKITRGDGMNIIIIGAQGSGKGTHSDRLSEKLGIPHISTGDIFRAEVKKGSELGKKVEGILNSGKLVPDEIVNEVLKKRLSEKDAKKGFILDGYPRNLEQAKNLDKIAKIDHVLYLEISDEKAIERISNRWQCKNCNTIYNLITLPPKKPGICDKCGGPLYQRDDDKEENVKKRLKIFHEITEPIIKYYKKKGILDIVNSESEVEETQRRIWSVMKNWKEMKKQGNE